MDEKYRLHCRTLCLQLAAAVCSKLDDPSLSVVAEAEQYWQWLAQDSATTSLPATAPDVDDNISF